MPSNPSALSPEQIDFCHAVAAFCDDHMISQRKLSGLADSPRTRFSKTEAHRLLHAECSPDVIDRVRPALASAFVQLLEDKGYLPTEIEAELSNLFDPKEYIKMIANRCSLDAAAIRHFGLKFDPFDVDHLPAKDEIYTNPQIEAVVGRLKDAVLYQRFVAIIGGVGTGKTLLKLRVATELNDEANGKTKLLYPEFPDMQEVTVHGIVNRILAELGQKVPQIKEERVVRLREVLTQMQQEGIGVAVIIDEAHRLHDKVLSSLKNFWEMTNGSSSRLLGVILFGQPSFVDSRLRDVRFKEIRQRVQIIDMPPLNGSTRDYIAHRLALAGGDIDRLFEAKAIERIAINAQTPLAIGNLVNGALMSAFEEEEPMVTVAMPYFKNLSTGQQVLGMRRSA